MRHQIRQVSRFVHNFLIDTGKDHKDESWGPKYRWEHTLRVAYWAWILAKEENVDVEKSVLAAMFHDISHFISDDYRKHGEKSAEIAEDYMRKAGFSADVTEEVCYAVKSHVGERAPKTKQAKILQDADTLDRFGHFRILLFGKNTDTSDLQILKKKIENRLEYLAKIEGGAFGPMWTKTGMEKTEELFKVCKAVYSEILSEIHNTRTPETYI